MIVFAGGCEERTINADYRAVVGVRGIDQVKIIFRVGTAATIMVVVLILFMFPVWVSAAGDCCTGSLGLAMGYDDNPGQDDVSQGSFYVLSRLAMASRSYQLTTKVNFDSSVYFSYQALAAVDDNYTLGVETRFICPFSAGRGLLALVLNPELYRDHYRTEDEANVFAASLAATWFGVADLDATLAGELTYFDYLHEVNAADARYNRFGSSREVPGSAGRSLFTLAGMDGITAVDRAAGSGHSPGGPPENGSSRGGSAKDREDWLSTGRLTLEKNLPGFVTLLTEAAFSYLDSTVMVESYRGWRLAAGFTWLPVPEWELGLLAWRRRQVFIHVPHDEQRHDHETGIKFTLMRRWQNFTLFTELLTMHHQSPVEIEDYRRNVIQCGVYYSF